MTTSFLQGLALLLGQEPDFEGLAYGYDGLEALLAGLFWNLQLAARCASGETAVIRDRTLCCTLSKVIEKCIPR
jgi:hypothetical protein